jgi:hypothetical protein
MVIQINCIIIALAMSRSNIFILGIFDNLFGDLAFLLLSDHLPQLGYLGLEVGFARLPIFIMQILFIGIL